MSFAHCAPLVMGSRRRIRTARGFTLIELMMVIAIIGMCAAIASPAFINLIRDSRANKASLEIADMYRLARSRAMGRGSAVMVRWTQAGGVGSVGLIEIREAITPGAVVPLPSSSCATTDWTNASATSRHILNFDLGNGAYTLVSTKQYLVDPVAGVPSGSSAPFSEICFTPRGRTYFRSAPGAAFSTLIGVPHFELTNTRTSRVRTVFVPANGAARIAL